jgi:hypothetical protein
LDSLRVAALGLHNVAIEGREGRIELPNYADYIDRSLIYRHNATDLGVGMIQRIDQQDRETAKTARSMLHRLSTIVCGMSIENVHAFADFDSSGPLTTTEKQNFNYLTRLIQYSFLDLHEAKAVKGSEKGDLHELLYLLDTNYLFATGDSVARKWYGIASADRHDAPRVGYPSKKRGLDFVFTNNFRAKLVQLKSSRHDDSEYHPWILKIEEENFQEVDKRRLGAKLNAYQQWIESDFDPALRAKVDKYILPSAR